MTLNCDCNLKKVFNYLNKTDIKLTIENTKCREDNSLSISLSLQDFPSCDANDQIQFSKELIKIEPAVDQLIFEDDPLLLKCKINRKQLESIGKYKILKLVWFINGKRAFKESTSEENEISLSSVNRNDHDGTWKCVLYDDKRVLTQSEINIKIIENMNKIYCPQVDIKTYKGLFQLPKLEAKKNITLNCTVNYSDKVKFECLSNGKWSSSYIKNIEICEFESNLTRNLFKLSKETSNINEITNTIRNVTNYKFNINDLSLILAQIDLINTKKDTESFEWLLNYISSKLDDNFIIESLNFKPDLIRLVDKFYYILYNFALNEDIKSSLNHINVTNHQNNSKIVNNHDISVFKSLQSNNTFRIVSSNMITFKTKSIKNTNLSLSFNFNDTLHRSSVKLVYFMYNGSQRSNWTILNNIVTKPRQSSINILINDKNLTLVNASDNNSIFSLALAVVSSTNLKLFNPEDIIFKLRIDFNTFKYKSIYYSGPIVIILLWLNVLIYLFKSNELLMPRKFRHCLINIWLNFLFLHFFEIIGLKQYQSTTNCFLFAFLIHYFTLSSCFWYNLFFYEFFKKLNNCRKNNDTIKTNTSPVLPENEVQNKKMISLSKPITADFFDDNDDDYSDSESQLNADSNYEPKPVAHLYMISNGIPLILCSIGLALAKISYIRITDDYVDCEYCYPSQFEAVILTLAFPICILLIFKIIFILMSIYTTYKIVQKLNIENELDIEDKSDNNYSSNDLSTCTSVMDSQFKPKYQIIVAVISFLLLLSKSAGVFYLSLNNSSAFENYFSHFYSILVILYSIINFSFYFLSRDDIHFTYLYSIYDKFRPKRLPPKSELYSSGQSTNEYEVPSDNIHEIINDPKEEEKLLQTQTPSPISSVSLTKTQSNVNLLDQDKCVTPLTNEPTTTNSYIHFIDTPTSIDDKEEPIDKQLELNLNLNSKRKTQHQRNQSILSGQLNDTEQLFFNSIVNNNQNESQLLNSTTKTNGTMIASSTTLTRKPIYVFVDHSYQEKIYEKVTQKTNEHKYSSVSNSLGSTQSIEQSQSSGNTEKTNYLHEIDLLIQKLSPWTQRLKSTNDQILKQQETSV